MLLWMNLKYREFIKIIYTPKIHDYIRIEDWWEVNIDKGSMGGTHWVCFVIKHNRCYYFDSFGGQPDTILLSQWPKPMVYQNYKFKERNSKLCGYYCLYFF